MRAALVVGLLLSLPAAAQDWQAAKVGTPVSFTAKETGYFQVTVRKTPEGMTPLVRVSRKDGGSAMGDWHRVTPGVFTMQLVDRWGGGARFEGKPFEVRVRFVAETDPSEPANDERGAARAVTLGAAFRVDLLPRRDVDWLAIEAPAAGYLTLKRPAKTESLRAEWHGPQGKLAEGDEVRVNDRGRVLLRLAERWSAPLEALRLRVEFTPESDPLEPNDRVQDAVALPIGQWTQVVLRPKGDRDLFAVTAPFDGYLRCEVAAVPKPLRELRVKWLDPKDSRRFTRGWAVRVRAGQPLVASIEERWGIAAPGAFRLRVTAQREFDAVEGKLLKAGTYPVGIWPPGDRTTFRFELKRPATVRVDVSGVPDTLTLQLGGVALPGLGVAKLLPAGRHEVVLADRWGSGDPRPFALTLAITDEPDESLEVIPLTLGETRAIDLRPAGDVDWCALELPHAGVLELRYRVERHENPLEAELTVWTADGRQRLGQLTPGGLDADGLRHGAALVGAGPVRIRARLATPGKDEPVAGEARIHVTLVLHRLPERSALETAIVGLNLDEKAKAAYRKIAEESGSPLLLAGGDEELAKALLEAVKRVAPAPPPAKQTAPTGPEPEPEPEPMRVKPRWPLPLLLILLLLILAWVLRYRHRPVAEGDA